MRIEIAHLDLKYRHLRIADPRRQAMLLASLASHGQHTPVLVCRAGDNAPLVLVDGYARVAALVALGRDEVEACGLDAAEPDALVLGHALGSPRRRSSLEEAWLIRELCDSHGLSQRDVARRLGRSTAWVSRRLGLLQAVPEAVQQAVTRGVVPPHAAMRCLIPLARANASQCATLVERLGSHPVSARELERLYVGWRRAGPAERQRIVESPELYLRAGDEAAIAEPPDPGDRGATLVRRDFEVLCAVAHRARRRVHDGALRRSDPPYVAPALEAFSEAKTAFTSLTTLVEKEACPDAGLRHPDRHPAAAP